MISWLGTEPVFPPLHRALREPNGLLAAGGKLNPEWLLAAYRQGIFPWFNPGDPILWWSPSPRMVLVPAELKISRSLAKTLRNKPYEIRTDTAFRAVMQACGAPREPGGGTWITDEMIEAYSGLHDLGMAHSIETWMGQELAGGLYGVAIGRMFYGESMFSRRTDASKLAFVHLVRQLERWGFGLVDCQMRTEHLASLGAREIPRADFTARLKILTSQPDHKGPWQFEPTAALVAEHWIER